MSLEARLWTSIPSFLMHSVDQNKSQVLSKFNRWGNWFQASMGELGRGPTKHLQAFFVANSAPIAQQNQSLCSRCSVVKSPGTHTTTLLLIYVYIHLNMACLLQAPALSTILKIAVPGWWRCIPGNTPLRAIEQLFLVLSWHVSEIPMRCPQSQIQPHQPQWLTVFPEPRIRTTSSSSKLFLSGILTQQTWKATDKYTVDKGVSTPIWMEEPCFVDHCILWALSTKSDSYILLRACLLLTENKWMTFATQVCPLE